MKKIFLPLIILLVLSTETFSQNIKRYIDSIFTVVQTHTNQIYTTAPELNSPYMGESQTSDVQLKLHIFQPEGDNIQKRPMLVCFHGGGFMTGNKEHDDMMKFCRIFAKKGYVTSTAQYRLGMNPLSNTSGQRSVYRAIQDSRALLRYLRENANSLKISPDHIYILGSSAGAFIALHNILMNKESERPAGTYTINNFPPTLDNGPDLGTLDAIGSYFTHSSQAKGIIALWGAIKHTNIVEAGDHPQIPIFLVHGTADAIVPFGLGSPFQLPSLAPTYGSQLIDQRLNELNYPHDTYFVSGEGHEFYGVSNGMWNPAPNQYWYIVVDKVRDFLYNIHKPTAAFNHTVNNAQVTFTNTSTGAIAWNWDFGDGETSTEKNPVHTYKQSGTYNVTLSAFSEVYSADVETTSVVVNVLALPNQVVLVEPANNAVINQSNILLKWNLALPQVDKYWLEIADNASMNNPITDQNITGTEKTIALSANKSYWWYVKAHNLSGWGEFSTKWKFTTTATGVDNKLLPVITELYQNYPNPFNPFTVISWQLAIGSHVTLKVYDVIGREVATLVDEQKLPGNYEVKFDGSRFSSGMYFYKIMAGNYISVKKCLLIK
jgi:PKD repeat protein/predicted esterase